MGYYNYDDDHCVLALGLSTCSKISRIVHICFAEKQDWCEIVTENTPYMMPKLIGGSGGGGGNNKIFP